MRRVIPVLLLLFAAGAAQADERILRYLSVIQIQKDSSIEVAETIDVRVENDQIKHGIYRDFPTGDRSRSGTQGHAGFKFEAATLDGQPVPASIEGSDDGFHIKIGDREVLVPVGEHEYVIRYRATREIGRFSDADEIYWNATGTGWAFPIDVAEARIRLPQAVGFGQRAVYTGPERATAHDAEVVDEHSGDILFRTTRPLGVGEGLTVAVAFPKGVVALSSSADGLSDSALLLVSLLALIGLCGFYYVAWRRAGRDPPLGPIVPLFSPPDGLSPPAMRYVWARKADNRTLAAALVDMAARGHLKMTEVDRGPLLSRKIKLDRLSGSDPLPSDEEVVLPSVAPKGKSIVIGGEDNERFSRVKQQLRDVLKDKYEGHLFKRNYAWAIAGALMFIAVELLIAALVRAAGAVGELSVASSLASLLFVTAGMIWSISRAGPIRKLWMGAVAILMIFISLSTGLQFLRGALDDGWSLSLIVPVFALPLVISAFWWMAAPTREGVVVLRQIDGFRQYLSITERDRLDRMTPPEDTPALFEKYLPYAIALDVENHWAKRFAGVLAAATAQGQQGFGWYVGTNTPWTNPTGFVSNVGSSLSSAIGSAAGAGSGGGGFSGGGGGGGGGGGW